MVILKNSKYFNIEELFLDSRVAYLLGATLNYHLKNAPEVLRKTATKLLESFYVDHCVTSVEDIEELKIVIRESKFLLSSAKFDLRGWERIYFGAEAENSFPDQEQNVPVLGLNWNLIEDTLFIDLREYDPKEEILTKTKILSLAHRIFNPIGYTLPIILRPKIMLQACWRLKVTWDTELPITIKKKIEKW